MRDDMISDGKQHSEAVLKLADSEPISNHQGAKGGELLVEPVSKSGILRERLLARARQRALEDDRLAQHQRIALRLLADPSDAHRLVADAKAVVERWRANDLCSGDYIERWAALLSLERNQLAVQLCGELDGWGNALRQNSPWNSMA